jgi:two-component system sensor kinase FixL
MVEDRAALQPKKMSNRLHVDNARLVRAMDDNGRLHAERLHLARIVEFSNDAIVSIDLNGVVTSWNHAASCMFGYEKEEIVGRKAALLFPPDRLHEEDEILKRIENGESVAQYETVRLSKDGTQRQVSLRASPIVDVHGKIMGVSKIIRDITAQKQAQEELRVLQAEMVHLSRWNMMGMMAASLAHELNQPLTAIINYVRATRRMLGDDPGTAKAREFLDKAADETKLAGGIVRALREFIQKRETSRKPEDLNSVLEDGLALSLYVDSADKAKIGKKLAPGLPPVLVDRVQIQQVLLNLVRNAFEAMHDDPNGRVGIETGPGEAGWLQVTVSDTGPGLPPQIAAQLFQPFQTTKQKGMGVGLSICQMIVESHGGRIWAEPNTPRGVIFRFSLPVAPAP